MNIPTTVFLPLIKEFVSDSGKKYLYDGFSNEIYPLEDKDIIGFKTYDFSPVYKIRFPFTNEQLLDGVQYNLSHLILNVTNQCNLRCDYCSYSGNHYSRREHSMQTMTFVIGRKALDWFCKHSQYSSELVISFYGGEPLLSFSLIEELVKYAKEIFPNKLIKFQITTNGTLLKENVCKWLSANSDVIANVTINGEKELHDRFRHHISGDGSYEEIINNLRLWKQNFPESFKKQVYFSINYLNVSDLIRIKEWFIKEPIFYGKLPLAFRRISLRTAKKELKEKFDSYINRNEVQVIEELKCNYIKNLQNKTFRKNVWGLLWDTPLAQIHFRQKQNLQMIFYYTGGCAPLFKRTFIDVDGNIKLCEKADGKAIFGNIKNGINNDLLIQLVNEFERVLNIKCHSCWALRGCRLCLNDVLSGNKVDEGLMDIRCSDFKISFLKDLELYCSINERGQHLFDHLIPLEYYIKRSC